MTTQVRLDTILELQELDMRIAELARRRAEIPRHREEVARDITALETDRRAREEALERARLDRRARESELEEAQGRRERYERQLNEVKTNVAYSALLTEIQGTKRRIAELEDEILELMAAREEHEKRIAEIDSELVGKRAAAAGELEALAAEETELERNLAERRVGRERTASEIEPRLLRLYDRLRRANRFPALVPLRGQACGACHGRLPPQVVREITHETALHPCEGCGALVYSDENRTRPEAEPAPDRARSG